MRSTFGKLSVTGMVLALLLASPGLWAAETESKAKDEKAEAKAEESASNKKEEAAAETQAAEAESGADGEAKAEAKPAAGRKSPALAGGLAFFPGVAVHGAGHMYAGSWMKGLGLLAIEGVALGVGINTATRGIDNMQKVADGISKGGSLTGAGDAFRDAGVVLVCGMAFLWTWFDDMAGAPIAAGEYNRLQDESAQARLRLVPQGDGVSVALVRNF